MSSFGISESLVHGIIMSYTWVGWEEVCRPITVFFDKLIVWLRWVHLSRVQLVSVAAGAECVSALHVQKFLFSVALLADPGQLNRLGLFPRQLHLFLKSRLLIADSTHYLRRVCRVSLAANVWFVRPDLPHTST